MPQSACIPHGGICHKMQAHVGSKRETLDSSVAMYSQGALLGLEEASPV
eukprot:CAMPEP_0174386222 /NCGR_PEP_ID=MMETSP0811_2-20130205/127131_1 /TAXON_ID=73025 ORGANISM="Eutreptiella gymnastica-like, Strain CCMP1594" /NCGR_SAMPLE_ID=MMETSP0811_2 /ASSEMBLY_ACC=CAM_ASM_000667 /LENGTH=48 /DNA_ID= /DNA_START= /DNA_END= /DNA_ORIENTATION=